MFIRSGRSGMAVGVSAVALAAVVMSPVLVGCGDDKRPPKPDCPAGNLEAEWDDEAKKWECVYDNDNDSSRSGGSVKHRRR